jgi:hypothetical protein
MRTFLHRADVGAQAAQLEPGGVVQMSDGMNAVAAVVASRETTQVLEQTLRALAAARPSVVRVDVMVNGNTELARQIAARLADFDTGHQTPVWAIWHHPLRDKANALNHYLHEIWAGGSAYFVDGYVRVKPDALGFLQATLVDQPEALAAAAVPSAGRSAAALALAMQRDGGLHGNLFVLRATTMTRLKADGFNLPVGMYRVDATLGSVLSFNFDPSGFPWDPKRYIAIDARATWDIDVTPWWRASTVRAHLLRRVRQSQGQVENWAVRHWLALEKRKPSELQTNVHELITAWRARDPEGYRQRLMRHPMRVYALNRLYAQTAAAWTQASRPYELIFEKPASQAAARRPK